MSDLFVGQEVDSTDAQCTPRDLAVELGRFDLDPCSNHRSHVDAGTRYTLEAGQDGLVLPWFGLVWCNGPYSDPLPWCHRLHDHTGPWVSLWKLDTTTRWWARLMSSGATWAPFRARLRFERAGNCAAANFASVMVWKGWTPPPSVAARLWMPVGVNS